jgi:hypothetical protein
MIREAIASVQAQVMGERVPRLSWKGALLLPEGTEYDARAGHQSDLFKRRRHCSSVEPHRLETSSITATGLP